MRRTFVLLVLSLAISSIASAAGWKKAYFGATKPGTWARYIDHSSDPANVDMTVTLDAPRRRRRAAADRDEDGLERQVPAGRSLATHEERLRRRSRSPRLRSVDRRGRRRRRRYADGARCEYGQAHRREHAGLRCGGHVQRAAKSSTARRRIATATRSSVRDRRPRPAITGSATRCRSASCGTRSRSPRGTKTTKFERKLVAKRRGSGAAVSTAAKPPAKTAFTLKEAYDEGLIRIDAEVDDAVKNGEKVHLHITAKEDAPSPMTVTIPKGKTSLHVDMPIDDFIIDCRFRENAHAHLGQRRRHRREADRRAAGAEGQVPDHDLRRAAALDRQRHGRLR